MFRACTSGITQAIASASNHIHTSAVLQAVKKAGARNKKFNLHKTGRRAKVAAKNRPSPVLGARLTEAEEKWRKCDLAKILIHEDSLSSSTPPVKMKVTPGEVEVPVKFGFGVDAAEQKILLDYLPVVTTDIKQGRDSDNKQVGDSKQGDSPLERYNENLRAQLDKANVFSKFLDLRNANAKGISYVNRRRIIFAFSTPQNPFDTGRTEVQAALMTYKIRQVWKHLTVSKPDTGNRRNLRHLVHKRAKMLRYLKRIDRARYEILLDRLSLVPESVEGELVV